MVAGQGKSCDLSNNKSKMLDLTIIEYKLLCYLEKIIEYKFVIVLCSVKIEEFVYGNMTQDITVSIKGN